MKSKVLTIPDGYKTLVRRVAREIEEIEFFVRLALDLVGGRLRGPENSIILLRLMKGRPNER